MAHKDESVWDIRSSQEGDFLITSGFEKGIVKHPFPVNYILKPWKLGRWVYQVIKFGIVQYMIIKALAAVSAIILEALDIYCEGEFKWNCGDLWHSTKVSSPTFDGYSHGM